MGPSSTNNNPEKKSPILRHNLVNQVAIALTILEIPYFILFRYFNLPPAAWLVIIALTGNAVVLLLNQFRFYQLASSTLIANTSAILLYYSCTLGKASGAHYVYFALAGIPFALFELDHPRWILFTCSIPVACIALLTFSDFTLFTQLPLSETQIRLIEISASLTTLIIVISTSIFAAMAIRAGQRQIIATNNQLNATNQELIQSMEDLRISRLTNEELARHSAFGQLTQGIAHEIRNPLAILRTAAEVVLNNPTDTDACEQFAQKTVRVTSRLAKLTSSMLQYGNTSPNEFEYFEIDEILEDLCELAEYRCKEANITLRRYGSNGAVVFGDRVFIYQAILNILTNAIQFTPPGGKITISCDPAHYKDRNSQDRVGVRITIADTGAGIDPGLLPSIFEPYVTTKNTPENTGLGLSFVQKIILEHNGLIEVSSIVGSGTQFRIYLPSI
ncbi:sensor histidine kinase [bacterium]|nr:sensor histidine kinase [bacterium]